MEAEIALKDFFFILLFRIPKPHCRVIMSRFRIIPSAAGIVGPDIISPLMLTVIIPMPYLGINSVIPKAPVRRGGYAGMY
jgi:hypothetical protein